MKPDKIEIGQLWEMNNSHRESANPMWKYTARHSYDNSVVLYLVVSKVLQEKHFPERVSWNLLKILLPFANGSFSEPIYVDRLTRETETNILDLNFKGMLHDFTKDKN